MGYGERESEENREEIWEEKKNGEEALRGSLGN